MQRVTELTEPPIVGKRYLVPCVQRHSRRWIPVLGPLHGDAELGIEADHWHYDFRFLSKAELDIMGAWLLPERGVEFLMGHLIFPESVSRGPEERVKVCRREQLRFPAALKDGEVRGPARGVHRMMEGVVLKPGCRTCPHRGFPLSAGKRMPDGSVVCAGHGARWNLKTGELISRRIELSATLEACAPAAGEGG